MTDAEAANLDLFECVVLSALMNGADALPVVAEDFSSPPNRMIFNRVSGMCNRGLLAVTAELRSSGELEKVGGEHRVTEIQGLAHDKQTLEWALANMLEHSQTRQAAKIGERLRKGEIDLVEALKQLEKLNRNRTQEKSWDQALAESAVSTAQLHDLKLTPRQKLLGDWFAEGDLGFIFAFRGTGKTWFGVAMANALATGGKLGEWSAHEAVTVGYLDTEMPIDKMRERFDGFGVSDNLLLINHEVLFERSQKVFNIADPQIQAGIMKWCVDSRIKVLFIDNLSTAAFGLKENEADSWEKMIPWLLDLRRRRIAVVIVHHAGRSGEMRGTSKREDNVFWIIALDDTRKNADDKRGARFVSRFTKESRNTQEEVPAFEWHFVTESDGEVTMAVKQAQTLEVFRRIIEAGVTKPIEIAKEMKLPDYTISRMAKKAIDAGWLTKSRKGEYELCGG